MKKIILSLIVVATLVACNQPKTAYVDNTVLLKEYEEMKAVEAKFTTRSERMNKQMDSIAQEFQIEVQDYQKRASRMSTSKRQEEEQALLQKQQK